MTRIMKNNLIGMCVALFFAIILIIISRLIILKMFADAGYTESHLIIIAATFFTYGIPLFIKNLIDEYTLSKITKDDVRLPSLTQRLRDEARSLFSKDMTSIIIISIECIVLMYVFRSLIINFLFGFCDNPMTMIELEHEVEPLNVSTFVIAFISIVLVSPVFEELFFRGMVIKDFRYMPWQLTLVCSVILFALSHNSLEQILIVIPLGFICGLVMHRTSNILYCIVLHAIANLTSLLGFRIDEILFSYKYVIEHNEILIAKSNCFFEAVLLVLIVLLVFISMKRLSAKEEQGCEIDSAMKEQSKKYRAVYGAIYVIACSLFAIFVASFIRLG